MISSDEKEEGPNGLGDLPFQPTGSGVADLEIAYEQMKVAEGGDLASSSDVVSASDPETDAHPS